MKNNSFNNKKFPDCSFQVEYAHSKKASNDPRRHKHRCAYYDNNHCTCPKSIEGTYNRRCKGSTHCRFYLERDNELTDIEVEEIHRTMLMDDSDFK